MTLTRKTEYAAILLVFAIAVLPFSVFSVPASWSINLMHTSPLRCEAMISCPMQAQVNPAPKAEPLPRASTSQPFQCPLRSSSQQSTQETIMQSMIGINGRVSGIRRIYPKNVLDHPQRKEIYNLIVTYPGIDLGRIGKVLDLNRETLRYHIDLLRSSNKIVVMKDQGIIRHYENHGRYGLLERNILAYLWNPTAEQILSIVQSNPEITQRDVATRLSLASPSVHWYMQRLINDGIVKAQRAGRLTNYSITEEAIQVLANYSIGVRQYMKPEACAQ